MQRTWCIVAVCLLVQCTVALASDESFSEELLIRPLKDKKVMSHFQFTTQWKIDTENAENYEHYNYFPKSVGQTIHKFEVEELHLSFTQGRWWNDRWGSYPVLPAPVGVELWTWFNSDSETSVDNLWKGLTGTLSGVFCASMEQMGATVTSNPNLSFGHEASSKFINYGATRANSSSEQLRYSILPREAVCTENLTPWIKMLPCRNKAGLGSLLNALALYDVHYHSMGIHIRTLCDNKACKTPTIELVQSLTIVFDPKQKTNSHDWSLQSLFNKGSVEACPLASLSNVYLELPTDYDFGVTVTPQPTVTDSGVAYYDLKSIDALSLSATVTTNTNKVATKSRPTVSVQHYVTGYGQEFGGFATHIFNEGETDVKVNYYEMVPWYLRLYFHTFKFHINDTEVLVSKAFEKFYFIPSENRASPASIEFTVSIPARSTVYFTVQFEKAFLHWTEHPPDANRGFDLGSSVVTAHFDNERTKLNFNGLEWSPFLYQKSKSKVSTLRVYSEGILVSLPTPDFSMPYNVITLTGTILALFFGSMYNTLVRRMRDLERIGDDFVSTRPAARLYRKILRFIDGEL